jgi:phenylpropionate dioxygenase-like ring-hydroxylating dioxygenase large terminal subunit
MRTPTATAEGLARIQAQLARGRAEWQDDTTPEYHIPVSSYFSPEQREREIERLFRPLPLVCAHSSELAAGQVLAHDDYGVPILLSRDADGTARAFLNVCRHRGMRLLNETVAQSKASLVCPYHGWTYQLGGKLRHVGHAEQFDACAAGGRDLVKLPCEERHGLVWVVPDPKGSINLDSFLAGMNDELPFYKFDNLSHFRTSSAVYHANWKFIIDAFLESYHIKVLHQDTIYPFFTDGIVASRQFGPHIHSLVARRAAKGWQGDPEQASLAELCKLSTPSHILFPNTITIFHPDYLSLISLYPVSPEQLQWTHRMLVPKDKLTPDWQPHWDKTHRLIEETVFQQEDIRAAEATQRGLKSGANEHLTAGRMEQGLGWFHASVARALAAT